jgi:hypothetical protein
MLHFSELMSFYELERVFDGMVSKQLISLEDLLESIGMVCSEPDCGKPTYAKLDDDCIKTLTRIVSYRRLVYECENRNTIVEVRLSDRNDFPAIGIELWINGLSSLPGGICDITSYSSDLVNSLAEKALRL